MQHGAGSEPAPTGTGVDGGAPPITDLGFARLDTGRLARTGDPEVVYGAGKTPAQTVALLRALREAHPERAVLATRLDDAALAAVAEAFGDEGSRHGVSVDAAPWDEVSLDEVGRTAVLGALPTPVGLVAVVAAGTSDAPVAAEAATTARAFGAGVRRVDDVGVAGLHRLLAARDDLADADALVVVAGMEGALPSVVGGLTGVPLVAVPTSVGYGASFGGVAALLAMLNSCAPGVVVVNIDNGFGAGVHAARIARAVGAARASASPAEAAVRTPPSPLPEAGA